MTGTMAPTTTAGTTTTFLTSDQQQVNDTQQQPAITNTEHQQAQTTPFQIGTVKEEANVLMVVNTCQNSTSVVNTDKDILLIPLHQKRLPAVTLLDLQLPIAPTARKATTLQMSMWIIF